MKSVLCHEAQDGGGNGEANIPQLPEDVWNLIASFIDLTNTKQTLCYLNLCKTAHLYLKPRLCEWMESIPKMSPDHAGIVDPSTLARINQFFSLVDAPSRIIQFLSYCASNPDKLETKHLVWVVLIRHMTQYGIECLFRRHDQEAGFCCYGLHKFDTNYYGLVRVEPYTIGECYMWDFSTDEYVPMVESSNLMCNEAMVGMGPDELREVIDKSILDNYIIRSDIYLLNLRLVEPKPEHSILCAVWNGVPLFLDSMKFIRSSIWVYTGAPSLFKGARWWHRNKLDIEKHLLQNINLFLGIPIPKEKRKKRYY